MPVEATRLMNTLQQSPLPLPSNQGQQQQPAAANASDTYRYLASGHSEGQPPQPAVQSMLGKEQKMPNFGDLARNTPRDYLHSYSYLHQGDSLTGMVDASLQPRHNQITQQYSSSTDEGCDTDHGGTFL